MRKAQSVLSSLLALLILTAASVGVASEPRTLGRRGLPTFPRRARSSWQAANVADSDGRKRRRCGVRALGRWCPFCQKQLADVNAHLERFRALGLNVVSVSVDDVEEIAKFANRRTSATRC